MHADLPRDLAADVAYTFDGGDARRDRLRDLLRRQGGRARSTASRSIPAGPRTSSSTRCTSPPGSSTRCRRRRCTPETTDGREGFIHLYEMTRHRRRGRAALHPARLRARRARGPRRAGRAGLRRRRRPPSRAPGSTCTITPQYRNMRYWLEKDMRPVELALRGLPADRRRAHLDADPRRHRRLAPDRARRARRPTSSPACRRCTARSNGSACRTWPPPPACASASPSSGPPRRRPGLEPADKDRLVRRAPRRASD